MSKNHLNEEQENIPEREQNVQDLELAENVCWTFVPRVSLVWLGYRMKWAGVEPKQCTLRGTLGSAARVESGKEGVYGESWTGRKHADHDFCLCTCQQLNQIAKTGRKAESSTLDFHITYTWGNPILMQHSSCRGFGETWCLVGTQVGTLGREQVGPQYLHGDFPHWGECHNKNSVLGRFIQCNTQTGGR